MAFPGFDYVIKLVSKVINLFSKKMSFNKEINQFIYDLENRCTNFKYTNYLARNNLSKDAWQALSNEQRNRIIAAFNKNSTIQCSHFNRYRHLIKYGFIREENIDFEDIQDCLNKYSKIRKEKYEIKKLEENKYHIAVIKETLY